jgi:formate hydrogenlyase transcriptional activator
MRLPSPASGPCRISRSMKRSPGTLCDYHWPGNVRELKNLIERALIITSGSTLQMDLPVNQGALNRQTRSLDEVQKEHILSVMELTQWRIRGKNGAAEILGLKPTTLESKMVKIGIYRPWGHRM